MRLRIVRPVMEHRNSVRDIHTDVLEMFRFLSQDL